MPHRTDREGQAAARDKRVGPPSGPRPFRQGSHPLYLQAEEALSRLIQEGRFRQGAHLPPEPELARQMGISRATLREALRTFEDKGMITRRRGLGTFVNAPAHLIGSGLEQLKSVDTIAHRMGLICTTGDLEIQKRPTDEEMAIQLDVQPGDPVITVGRTKVTNGTIVAYMYDVSWLPVSSTATEELESRSSALIQPLEHLIPAQTDNRCV